MNNSKKINVHIFLRKPYKFENHSIEKLFKTIAKEKNNNFNLKFLVCPFHSSGFFKRIYNCIWAFCNQGEINHISGDINFISLFLNKNKTVNTFHDCYTLRRLSGLNKIIHKFFWFYLPMKKSKYITTVSNFTKNELKNFVKIKKKINVISNFLPYGNYNLNRKIKKNKILIIGTTKNKNLDRILISIKDIKMTVIIIGKINFYQTRFLIENKIEYKNYVNISEAKLINCYNQAKILLFPSLYEGFGLPILEAQRMCVPVITSNISPMKEISNNSSILVNPRDVNDIKKKLIRLSDDNKLRKKIIKKGYNNSLSYGPNHSKEKYFEIYKKIFSNKVK
tara:strand:- start:1361 stop:2371 length:1011 start_codon:yes stop_codon:yes gene_type:complete